MANKLLQLGKPTILLELLFKLFFIFLHFNSFNSLLSSKNFFIFLSTFFSSNILSIISNIFFALFLIYICL